MTQNTNNEVIIDFSKVFKNIIDNKKIIFLYFLISMSFGTLFYFILPKKYTSEAKILIKNSGTTNLSYINPYIIAEESENDGYNKFFQIKNSLNEEMEIIKSPLVIDNVIKENNLRYKKGYAKGKYISTEDFLKKNFNISKLKNANIIYITYKSKSPVLSYKIVNSIINNYEKIEEKLNIKKASTDTEFLKKTYLSSKKELDTKINELKKLNEPSQNQNILSTPGLGLLGLYDKRFKQKLKQISGNETDLKKLEIEITQKTEELNSLKKKLEWSSMVKEMSKKTSNMIILQSPKIKENYEFSEPQPLVIFILSIFVWIFMSISTFAHKKP